MTTFPIAQAISLLPPDRPVRFGVLATGHIARKVTRDMLLVPDDVAVTAVGSRTQASADDFASELSIPHAYGSYEELAASDEVDVIYVTTPHSHHAEAAKLCMDAGKHVLVEKPLTPSAAETLDLVQYAADKGVFLMEAVWTRCNPLMRRAAELVAAGTLGDVRWVQAAFAFKYSGDDSHRLVNPDLAGGAILDLGLYLATLTHALIGAPDACSVIGNPFHTGVDGTSCATFTWNATDARPPIYAQFMSSLEVSTHQQMVVSGTEGRLEIDKLSNPRHMRLVRGEEVEEMVTTAPGYGYTFQTQEVARCLRAGLAESPLVPWRATIEVAQMLDAWRAGIPAA